MHIEDIFKKIYLAFNFLQSDCRTWLKFKFLCEIYFTILLKIIPQLPLSFSQVVSIFFHKKLTSSCKRKLFDRSFDIKGRIRCERKFNLDRLAQSCTSIVCNQFKVRAVTFYDVKLPFDWQINQMSLIDHAICRETTPVGERDAASHTLQHFLSRTKRSVFDV